MNLKRSGRAVVACIRERSVLLVAVRAALKGVAITTVAFFIISASAWFDPVFCMAGIPGNSGLQTVAFIYDGDTVRTGNGLIIRYIGIDTPERGEPFYSEARKRNVELVGGKEIVLVVCKEEPKDKYGRTLGWIYVDGTLINAVLLEEGLAKTLIIPPCGTEKREELLGIERKAKEARVGLWK